MSIHIYCKAPTHVLDDMQRDGMLAMHDLFRYARPTDTDAPHKCIYKKDLLNFVNKHYRGLNIDFDALLESKTIIRGGVYPLQWLKARYIRSRHCAEADDFDTTPVSKHNGCFGNDDDALAEAMRISLLVVQPQSLEIQGDPADGMMKDGSDATLSVRVDKTSPHTDADTSLTIEENAPYELCCPISLELFRDPVQTLRGVTYERAVITDWFKRHDTDPMSGEHIHVKTLWRDTDMILKCHEFRYPDPPLP